MMDMREKIEIMLGRKHIRKTDFANSIGVTYRAFANYMNGSRTPRGEVLDKIAEQLDVSKEFLIDNEQELELTIEERFIKRTCSGESGKAAAARFLEESRGLFAGNALSEEDKELLLKCLIEIFYDSRK